MQKLFCKVKNVHYQNIYRHLEMATLFLKSSKEIQHAWYFLQRDLYSQIVEVFACIIWFTVIVVRNIYVLIIFQGSNKINTVPNLQWISSRLLGGFGINLIRFTSQTHNIYQVLNANISLFSSFIEPTTLGSWWQIYQLMAHTYTVQWTKKKRCLRWW